MNNYVWKDDSTICGANYDPDILNECLMHLKYNNGFLPIGVIFPCVCTSSWIPENAVPVDGAEYLATQFPVLWNDYLTAETPKLVICTYAEYSNDIAAYGQCARFAIDIENGKFKVPTVKDGSYITQAKSNDEIGKAYEESLPNIHGYFTGGNFGLGMTGATGAFTPTRVSANATGTSGNAFDRGTYDGALFDASKSSAVYKDNAKVQGDNVRLRWFVVVATGTTNQSKMDWSAWATNIVQIQQMLSEKLDIDANNITDEGKSNLIGMNMPDYTKVVGLDGASGYTAPNNGLFTASWEVSNTSVWVTVNNIGVQVIGDNATGSTYNTVEIPLSKGERVECALAWRVGRFFPYKQ